MRPCPSEPNRGRVCGLDNTGSCTIHISRRIDRRRDWSYNTRRCVTGNAEESTCPSSHRHRWKHSRIREEVGHPGFPLQARKTLGKRKFSNALNKKSKGRPEISLPSRLIIEYLCQFPIAIMERFPFLYRPSPAGTRPQSERLCANQHCISGRHHVLSHRH